MAVQGTRLRKLFYCGMVCTFLLFAGAVWAQDGEAIGDTSAAPEGVVDSLAGMTDSLGEAFTDSLATGMTMDTAEPEGFFARISNSGLVTLFDNGGGFMWPLLALSVIGLAVFFERFWTFSKARTNVRKFMTLVAGALQKDGIEGAKKVCTETRGPISAVLHAGLEKAGRGPDAIEKAIQSSGTIEMSFLERGLVVISSVATIGPLLGFLGTVSGMINAFEAIAAADQVNAKVVAGGISEALITTATGLIIAIPAQAAYNYFVAQIDRFIIEMEEASTEMIDALILMEND